MEPKHYWLITTWRLRGPLREVFDMLFDSLNWPDWWPGSESVEELCAGDTQGAGSVRRYCWKSLLPYRLAFDAVAQRIEAPTRLEGIVDGELNGSARCLLDHRDGVTSVRFEWDVRTVKTWMNLLGPVAHPLFALNHRMLMKRGARGLARRTGFALLSIEHIELSPLDILECPERATRPSLQNAVKPSVHPVRAADRHR